jgi:membrane protease YdiL (CAAX protease family)
LTPQNVDKFSVIWILAGQGLILNMGIIAAFIGGFWPKDVFTIDFNSYSMMLASIFAVGLIMFGQIFDRLPFEFCLRIALDTRVFVLRIIGQSTSVPTALCVAALLSAGAGLSEELVFRGILFSFVEAFFGPGPAYIISSILFGLAHSPVFGANVVLEAFFGAFFAFSYVQSGYNLAVPVAVHTMYDFATIFVTWLVASQDLRSRIFKIREGNLLHLGSDDPKHFEALTKAVFETIDTKRQGFIDPKELELGMRLFG